MQPTQQQITKLPGTNTSPHVRNERTCPADKHEWCEGTSIALADLALSSAIVYPDPHQHEPG